MLIDLEGLVWADVEFEYTLLQMRFREHHDAVRIPGPDRAGLQLYRLALHLSLVEGPLRLIETGFPDSDSMTGTAEDNLEQVLATTAERCRVMSTTAGSSS